MIVKVLVLAALIRLLLVTNNPVLCSGIYSVVGFLFSLMASGNLLAAVISGVLSFVLATIWFWALNRYEDRTGLFWGIAAVGILIGIV